MNSPFLCQCIFYLENPPFLFSLPHCLGTVIRHSDPVTLCSYLLREKDCFFLPLLLHLVWAARSTKLPHVQKGIVCLPFVQILLPPLARTAVSLFLMLSPLVHHSLMRSTRRRLCVVGVPCRLSSTLGDIRAFLSALRERQQLPDDGSIIQLSITEDLRVAVERRAALPDATPQERSWQGTAATTLEEALRSLQPGAAVQEVSPSPSLPAEAHRPLPSPQQPQSPRRSGATVLDLTRVGSDEVRAVVRHVETSYPSLKLVVQHTSGKDLQGTRLHTFHVRLVPRAGKVGTATVVAPELQRLVDTFVGEGVGEGYTGSLRRALKEAFAAAQLPYVTFAAETAQSATLLSLYTQTWQKEGYQLSLRSALPLKGYVECSVRGPFGRPPLDTTTLPLTAAGLRDVLAFVDRVAAAHSPERHAAVTRRIRAEPLHLVLPSSRVKVKDLLRRLLFFHFGCLDGDVSFTSLPQAGGTHVAEIAVGLPPQQPHVCDVAADVPRFVVARATGTAAGATMQIAAVHAMQTLFPDLFEHQIAYHPEIREIQQSERASACANVPPHVSRGLDTVLRWALQLSGADFAVESILLKPSTPYPHWGVVTGTSTAWLSQLFVLRPPGSADSTATTTRELCGFAFDSRKSRSEQKVVAAALAKHFSELCRSAVDCARERNLIDRDGVAVPFGGVQSLTDSDTERYGEALFSDPCLAALAPSRCSTPQPLPDATPRVSALSTFWDAVALGEGVEPLSVRVQRADAATGYTAQCVTTLPGGEEVHRVVSEASATTEIGALLAVLDAAQCSPGAVSESPREGSSAATAQRGSADFLVGIPSSLPTTAPLQTCIDAVGRLYGLRCAVRILQEGMQYTAELSGSFPVDSPLLRRHGRIASSPFFLDRCFVLGRGHAESPLIAVVRAAQQVFEGHVRVHQRTFQDTILAKGLLHLQPAAESRLAQLLETVLTEITAVSENAVTESGLTLSFRHGEVCELAFSVSTAKQSIKLEETVCQRFLNCARELGQRMSAEMGAEFLPASTLSAVVANSAEGLLQQLCRLAYGLELRVETKLVHKRWHCRLSLPLTGELSCCIAVASANRKKEAVDAAALAVLSNYFAPETPHIPAYGAVASPRSVIDGEGDAVQTDMESYVFEASSAVEDITPVS